MCFQKLHDRVRGKKVADHWELPKITSSTVGIGTSNFRRTENIDAEDIQVFSFSGMTLHQLHLVLEGYKYGPNSKHPGMQPVDLFIMCGLNNMKINPNTNRTYINRVYSAARKQFPDTNIHFCQVPMKRGRFSNDEWDTISDLNREIKRLCDNNNARCISKIKEAEFDVDPADPIHWTRCADKVMSHILKTI